MYNVVLLSRDRESFVSSSDGQPVRFRDLEIAKKVGNTFLGRKHKGLEVKHFVVVRVANPPSLTPHRGNILVPPVDGEQKTEEGED